MPNNESTSIQTQKKSNKTQREQDPFISPIVNKKIKFEDRSDDSSEENEVIQSYEEERYILSEEERSSDDTLEELSDSESEKEDKDHL